MLQNQSVIPDIKAIIAASKDKAIRAVDNERTLMYWYIGQRIFEEEQDGKDRADYGEYLTKYISQQLEPEFGSGFSKRQIELFRQFYRSFPIANALRSQLSWTHYKLIIRLDSQDKIDFYIAETVKNNWNNTIRTEFKIKNWLEDGFATLNVSSTFNQKNVSGFETESNGYNLVNLGFGGTVKLGKTAFDVNINGNNLFDKRYIAHLSRLKTDGIPNIGRNIVLGVNFNL